MNKVMLAIFPVKLVTYHSKGVTSGYLMNRESITYRLLVPLVGEKNEIGMNYQESIYQCQEVEIYSLYAQKRISHYGYLFLRNNKEKQHAGRICQTASQMVFHPPSLAKLLSRKQSPL
ncbi:hypothetical protein C4D60_Mb01t32880 [Musa balbisiana]|uniref:Uncharacterized protein n=1 Tax=Musa balbisiana TaxID=52838 RepID=A0A4S8JSE4_MUSBA|nr:hypothetical protein C4D60_Mb01t32880 [Musa balbisiana]